jgi:integrase
MSEICGLKWDCIDFENNIITVKQARVKGLNNQYILKETKTYSSSRKLKTNDFIINKIKNLPKINEFIINITPKSIYDGLKRELKKNNLPDIRFHDLRHFNASIMLKLNIPDKYAMERGGWSTNYTMKNVYQHTFTKEREVVDNIVDNYFLELLSHELSHEN